MKVIQMMAEVNEAECRGCKHCEKVCPVLAVAVEDKRARVNADSCTGCGFCEQRCPTHAISMVSRDLPRTIGVSPNPADEERIAEICFRARLVPEQVVCYCTGTRADEVVAAILGGAQSPEAISAMTGARTGCGVLCIENLLRLLQGAGLALAPPSGHRWYGKPVTIWDLPEETVARYTGFGNRILEDRNLIERILDGRKRRLDHDSSR
jgi:ferredoxin